MKRFLFTVCLLLLFTGLSVAQESFALSKETSAELTKNRIVVLPKPIKAFDFALKTIDGKEYKLSDYEGKVVLLNFWATWCPPCRAEMPSIEKLNTAMKGKAFQIVAVSVNETLSTVTNFVKSNPYTFLMLLDSNGAVSDNYVSSGIPTTYIVDTKGFVVAGIVGGYEWNSPLVIKALSELGAK